MTEGQHINRDLMSDAMDLNHGDLITLELRLELQIALGQAFVKSYRAQGSFD
jgi:hypothetical protein